MSAVILLCFKSFLFIFDPESLLRYGGLLIAFLLIYGTTGIFFCFFIPSGAVLFTAGLLTATGGLHYNIITVCTILILASIAGNLTGYWFGRKAGPLLYKKEDSKFFRRQHLKTAETFYKKYGGLALTVGLYLPIIRTFASIVAGMIKVDFRRFLLLTSAGSIVWVSSFVLAGYFIGSMPFLKKWLPYIIIGFVLVVTVPLLIRVISEFRKASKKNKDENLLSNK
ncbi:MAG: VTT domain-containing protein [Chitinophagaceae bacterium]